MQCNKEELLDCCEVDLENDFENNAWNLEHNAIKVYEISNKIMKRIMSIITLPLFLRDKSILLLFSPIFISGNSFFLPIMFNIIFTRNFNTLLKVKLYSYYLTGHHIHYIP